jgi:MFS transporter, MHS family, proline/betaine transporter
MDTQPGIKPVIAAAVLANAMEWFDFTIFAAMTPIISKLFFPAAHGAAGADLNAILLTTALFGAGFFMRPVGGVLLGLYGDNYGRKAAMTLGMGIMALAAAIMTFAPTYASAGVAAPLLMLVARLLQGFSIGGEFGTSTAFLIELAPPNRTGFYGSWQMSGQLMSTMLGAALGLVVTQAFTPEQQLAGAWRIPFAVGLLIAPLTIYLRRHASETYARIHATPQALATEAASAKRGLSDYLIGMGMVVASTVSFYVTFGYTVTYAKQVLKLPVSESFMVQMIAAIVMLIVTPIAGALSDRYDRKTMLVASLGAYLVAIYPLYAWVIAAPSVPRLLITQIVIGVLSATFLGVYCTTLAEMFPKRSRATSLAVVNNVVVLIFGGFAQTFVTWLIALTGSPLAPVLYVMIGVAIALVAVVALKPSHFRQRSANAAPTAG